jgi:hypothetical protein
VSLAQSMAVLLNTISFDVNGSWQAEAPLQAGEDDASGKARRTFQMQMVHAAGHLHESSSWSDSRSEIGSQMSGVAPAMEYMYSRPLAV